LLKKAELEHWCGTVLKLRINITESKMFLSNENNENTVLRTRSLFLTVRSLKPSKLTVTYLLCKSTKFKAFYSLFMLGKRTNITEEQIVIRYKKSGDKLG
jgi:hypothetical protein